MNKSDLSSILNTVLSSKPSKAIRLLLMVLFLCVFVNVASAQTTLFQFNFENTITPNVDNVVGTPVFTSNGVTGAGYSTNTPCGNVRMYTAANWDAGDYYRFAVNTTGYGNMTFSFCNRTDNVAIGTFLVRVSSDSGSTWDTVLATYTPTTNNNTLTTATFPIISNNAASVWIEISKVSGAGNARTLLIDNATLSGYPIPTISSFTPNSGCSSSTPVVIIGTNFTGVTAVRFGGTNADSFVVNSSTQITAIPAAGNTGIISVVASGGTATSGASFTVNDVPATTGTITPATCNASDGAITITGLENIPIEFKKADNDHIDLGSKFLSNRGSFTLEGWVKFNIADVGARMSLFGQNDVIEFFLDTNIIQLYTAAGGNVTTPLTAALGNNAWHHIAATGDGARLRIYIDGALVVTFASTTSNYGTSTAFNTQIGSGVVDPLTTAGGGFTGQINKVGFYSTALSAATIAALASTPTTYTGSEAELLAGYNFTEGVGNTLTRLPAGINGTLTNSPQWIYTYSWTKAGTPIASTKNISGLPAGEYNLSIGIIGVSCPKTTSYSVSPTNIYNTSWSLGAPPTANQNIEFTGNYSLATDVTACSCTVTSGTVIIPSGNNLILGGKLTVNAPATLTFEDTSGLVQTAFTGANSGDITYKRKYTGGEMDYTYWSSPVTSQNLLAFSPKTKSDKFFSYNGADWVQEIAATTDMTIGKGYIIRGIPPISGPPPGLDTAIFTGVPNNGPQSITVSGGGTSNLIGNPYPSALDADTFILANTDFIDGALYFWTHNTPIAVGTPDPGSGVYAYSGNDYATYTLSGGVATKVGNLTSEWLDANKNRIVDLPSEFTDKNGNSTLDTVEWIDSNTNKTLETGEWVDTNKNNIAEIGEWTDINKDGKVDLPGEWTDSNGNGLKDFGEFIDADLNGIFNTGEWVDADKDKILDLEVEQVANKPAGKIAAGQSFFTTSTLAGGSVKFTNAMRVDGSGSPLNNSNFYKTKNQKSNSVNAFEKNRVWLDLTNKQGAFKQTLVGYITGATNNWDNLFDGESFDGNDFIDFYSINQEKNLTIQGRALPFDENDEVLLGYRIAVEGTFTIKIDQTDGLLANQPVFIEDKLTNTVFDLKGGNYTFNTLAGTFDDRFVLRYTNKTLGTNDLVTQSNQVLISIKNKEIKINSFSETIDKVTIYDVLGRQIYQNGNVNSNEFLIANLVSSHQTLIVKTSLQNGKTVTDKIIY